MNTGGDLARNHDGGRGGIPCPGHILAEAWALPCQPLRGLAALYWFLLRSVEDRQSPCGLCACSWCLGEPRGGIYRREKGCGVRPRTMKARGKVMDCWVGGGWEKLWQQTGRGPCVLHLGNGINLWGKFNTPGERLLCPVLVQLGAGVTPVTCLTGPTCAH